MKLGIARNRFVWVAAMDIRVVGVAPSPTPALNPTRQRSCHPGVPESLLKLMKDHITMTKFRYSLRLANGEGFELVVPPDLGAWIKNAARVLGLSPFETSGLPRLIFSRNETYHPWKLTDVGRLTLVREEKLPEKGWNGLDLGGVNIWLHPEVRDVVCEVGPEQDGPLCFLWVEQCLFPLYCRVREAGGFWVHAALAENEGKGFS